jgi:hypothetical protein
MASRQKERALTSPKTSALAFISVLPWRINDGQDTNCRRPEVGCSKLVKPLRGCDKSFSALLKADNYRPSEINESRIDLVKFTKDCTVRVLEVSDHIRSDR